MVVNKNIALLYGIMLGDGCIGKYRRKDRKNSYIYMTIITCDSLVDKSFVDKILVPLLKKFTTKKICIRKKKERAIEIKTYDKDLFLKLLSLGFPSGKKGPLIVIPKIFYKKNLIKHIIQGFFATDGSLVLTKNPNKFYPRLEAQAIHKGLIIQIYNYLTNLGMNGHFYYCKSKPDPRWKVVQERYKFQFNGKTNLTLFKQKIGFINPKHKQRFQTFIAYSKKYDKAIKRVASKNQSPVRRRINFTYFKNAGERI